MRTLALALSLSLAILTTPLVYSLVVELPEVKVRIINGMRPTKHALTIHCQSGDDDLGFQKVPRGKEFSWSFKRNVWGTTLFHCSFWWNFEEITNFNVYEDRFGWDELGYDLYYNVTEYGVLFRSEKTQIETNEWLEVVRWGYTGGELPPPHPTK